MLSKIITSSFTLLLFFSVSCASLNSSQERELKEWQAKDLEVRDKNPSTAAALNILPGIGDFYNGNIGYGVVNLLTWPLSVLWAPVGGYDGANEVNYYATKANIDHLEMKRKKLKNEVETAFIGNQISKKEYLLANKKVDAMTLNEFQKEVVLQDVLPQVIGTERIPSSTK